MNPVEYDLIVIGAGSGGVRAARLAGASGAKVAIIENRFFGGTCVNVGCVPKKLLVQASAKINDIEDAIGYGWSLDKTTISLDWPLLRDKVQQEVQRLSSIYNTVLRNNNVDVYEGHGSFVSNTQVKVTTDCEETILCAAKILVATGSTSFIPDHIRWEDVSTSDDLFTLDQLPEKCLIVGAGYIAVEFAGILNNFGCDVTLACRGETPLKYLDNSLREFLSAGIQAQGVSLKNNSQVKSVSRNAGNCQVEFDDGSTAQFDKVFYAIGRKPNTASLGLENTTVSTDESGAIPVDQNFKSNVDTIYAVGDVIGQAQLTPVALRQAMLFIKNSFDASLSVEPASFIPTAVFSQPELATVGMTENQAKEKVAELAVYQAEFKPLANNVSGNDERVFIKVLVDEKNNKLLGAHMGGGQAAEVIQSMAIAMEAGASKTDLDRTLGIHPSMAEEFVTLREPTRRYLNGSIRA